MQLLHIAHVVCNFAITGRKTDSKKHRKNEKNFSCY